MLEVSITQRLDRACGHPSRRTCDRARRLNGGVRQEAQSAVAFAIAIYNIPEGIAIAVPVYFATRNKFYAFGAILLSGLAEPIGAGVGYLVLSSLLSEAVFGTVFGLIFSAPGAQMPLPASALAVHSTRTVFCRHPA